MRMGASTAWAGATGADAGLELHNCWVADRTALEDTGETGAHISLSVAAAVPIALAPSSTVTNDPGVSSRTWTRVAPGGGASSAGAVEPPVVFVRPKVPLQA